MTLSRLLFLVCIALAVVLPVRFWVIEPIYIASPSMEPRLPVGGHVFMDKVTLRWRAPRRGEVIVFRSPVGGEHELVKRVIAVPGDTVELREKKLIL
ncbi:MAG: signal peptidase I, partial [Elusimicrobiota bacterium]